MVCLRCGVEMFAKHLVSLLIIVAATFSSAANLTREAETLLEFKQGLTRAEERLSGWTAANLAGVCSTWQGVICSTVNASVIGLNFTAFNLSGELTSPLCELPNLAELRIRGNLFNQSFPGFLIQFCKELTVIDFSLNWFYGQLPGNLSANLRKLQFFDVESNDFEGSIPPDLGNISQLRLLRLRGNSLSGRIPPELGRLTLLQILDLSYNPFDAQEIPSAFSNLSSSLQELDLTGCNLIDVIPVFVGNFSHLWFLDLSSNNLSGAIPSSLANLHNLTELYLISNQLTGPVPPFASGNLSILQLAYNSLWGTIPSSLTSLSSLSTLLLDFNLLSGTLPDALAFLPNLTIFAVSDNRLNGTLSFEWGLHSKLMQFDVSDNFFTGAFPPHICRGNGLRYLGLKNNYLTGAIPVEYNDCKSMIRLVANRNQLSGSVPSGLWTLPSLQALLLDNNMLSGRIILQNFSARLVYRSSLRTISLDLNQFEGALPSEVGHYWFSLTKLTASQNHLSGPLPPEVGLLSHLKALDLSVNSITGEIPSSIGNCVNLTSLLLFQNNLSGPIPSELSRIPQLDYLDLSMNHLNGTIPTSIAKSTYLIFDVAYNDLSGMVPSPMANRFNPSSFEGNPKLCLSQPCTNLLKTKHSQILKISIRLLVVIVILWAGMTLGCMALMVRMCRKRRNAKVEVVNHWTVVAFQSLGYNAEELYESLDEKNVIGWGGTGRVYKVLVDRGKQAVAVKKLTNFNPTTIITYADKRDENSAFRAEMEILGCNIKHKNIVKLMCACASKHTKLIVYEFMCHGSLGDVLHKAFRSELSCWMTRFEIALGAAEGLAYLHHDCVPPILHRDIKPNNILLDSSFQAKLADFGVAKSFQGRALMTSVVGSVGYIAPEYAYTLMVDEKSDVYSYGVVLLELVSGRSPASMELENEGVDLVRWVWQLAQSKDGLRKVFDNRLDVGESDKQSMVSVLKLALLCTRVLPRERPSMRVVVELLRQANPGPTPLQSHHHDDPSTSSISLSIIT